MAIRTAKKRITSKQAPERSIANETMVVAAAGGALVTGVFVSSLMLNPLSLYSILVGRSAATVQLLIVGLSLIPISIIIQVGVVLNSIQRIDNYSRRIMGFGCIILAAIVLLVARSIPAWLCLSIIGIIVLWWDIFSRNKLYWAPLPTSKLTRTQKQLQEYGMSLHGTGMRLAWNAFALSLVFAVCFLMTFMGAAILMMVMPLIFLALAVCAVSAPIFISKSRM